MIQQYCLKQLHKLERYDIENGSSLLETLNVYIRQHGDVKACSLSLIHIFTFSLHFLSAFDYNNVYDAEEDIMSVDELIKDEHVKLAIQLKTCQLQREQLASLNAAYVEATLRGYSWNCLLYTSRVKICLDQPYSYMVMKI